MENSDNTKRIQKELEDYIGKLKRRQFFFVIGKLFTTILLCGFLVLVFLLFSFKFYLFPKGHFYLDSEGNRLIWIAVAMVIFGLLWVLVRSSLQLKQYRKDIRRLEMLSLRAKIQPIGAEEEICKVLKSYYEIESEPKAAEGTETGENP